MIGCLRCVDCQWCKGHMPLRLAMTYCGKYFHWACYEKLRWVAIRTGGLL